jgi:hypothetical protein
MLGGGWAAVGFWSVARWRQTVGRRLGGVEAPAPVGQSRATGWR